MKRTTDDRDDDTEGHMPRIKPSADDDTNDAAVDTEGHAMKFRP